MVGTEGHHGQVPRPFDRSRKRSLVLGAHTCLTPSLDFETLGDEPPQPLDILVVNILDVVYAKRAHLSPREVSGTACPSLRRATTRCHTVHLHFSVGWALLNIYDPRPPF